MADNTDTNWAAEHCARMEAEFAAFRSQVSACRTGQVHHTGSGQAMTVNRTCVGHADVDDVLAGVAPAVEVWMTEDGRGANLSEWHRTEVDGESDFESWVFAEHWTAGVGRTWHGFVDARSRKVVQFG